MSCYTGFELVNGGCFGNYNPGQPFTVGPGSDSRSDQSVIVPLGQNQGFNSIYPSQQAPSSPQTILPAQPSQPIYYPT